MDNNKQLFINLLSNTLNLIAGLCISFFFTPYLIRTVGRDAFGFVPLANDFVNYISIVVGAFNSMAGLFITIKIHQQDSAGANAYFSTVFYTNIGLAALVGIFSVPMVYFLEQLIHIPPESLASIKLLFGLSIAAFVVGLGTSVFGVAAFCQNRLDISSGINIGSTVLKVSLLIILYSLLTPNIAYIGIVTMVMTLFIACANFVVTRKLLPHIHFRRALFDRSIVKKLVDSGVWNSVTQLSALLLDGLDLLIANIFIGPTAMSYLAIAKTIPTAIRSLISALVGAFMPQFTILYAKKDQAGLLKEIKFSIKLLGMIISIPVAGLVAYGDVFFPLWLPGQDVMLLQLLSIITLGVLFVSGSINSLYNVFTVTNKLRVPAIVLLITGLVNVSVVFLLLKTTDLGVYAIAGVSTILGIIRNLAFTPVYAARCLQIKWDQFYPDIFKGMLSICIITALLFGIKSIFIIQNWLSLFFCTALGGMMGLVINAFIILNKKERRLLVNFFISKINKFRS